MEDSVPSCLNSGMTSASVYISVHQSGGQNDKVKTEEFTSTIDIENDEMMII